MDSAIKIEQQGMIVEMILNRPENRNTMNVELMDAISDAVDEIEKLQSARVVIVRAEGKGFSAGLDLMGINQTIERFGENWREHLFPLTQNWQEALTKLEKLSLPTICAIHNYCVGGGMEIALACDFRIVADDARLSLPETQLGIIPDVGGTSRLTRLIGPSHAKQVIMSGNFVDLDNALKWGMVNYVVPTDELMNKARELAEEICLSAPLAVNFTKRIINDMTSIDDGLRLEAWAQSILMKTNDFEVGMQARISKDKPEWTGQ